MSSCMPCSQQRIEGGGKQERSIKERCYCCSHARNNEFVEFDCVKVFCILE